MIAATASAAASASAPGPLRKPEDGARRRGGDGGAQDDLEGVAGPRGVVDGVLERRRGRRRVGPELRDGVAVEAREVRERVELSAGHGRRVEDDGVGRKGPDAR